MRTGTCGMPVASDAVVAEERGRRFAAYGKACRDWHKKLNLDDVDSDSVDLVGAEEDGIDKLEPTIIYAWATGYKQYIAER